VLASQRLDVLGPGGVDAGGHEPALALATRGCRLHRRPGPLLVVVGDHEELEEVPLDGDAGGGVTDPAGADHEDAHGRQAAGSRRRLSSWPKITNRNAKRNIRVPITLTCTGAPRWEAPHTYIGKVIELGLALKLVMM